MGRLLRAHGALHGKRRCLDAPEHAGTALHSDYVGRTFPVLAAGTGGPVPPEHAVKRVAWLTGLVSQAQLKFPETGPAFLGHLRYQGGDNPYNGPLREWLHGWLANSPQGVSTDKIRGTLVLLGDCGAGWEEAAPRWLGLLDDPSDYVRACAARMLGKHCSAETDPSTGDLFELIRAKEILRPGIAGPFWPGPRYEAECEPDPVPWMMEILEKRQGDEPADLPFNGVDFHLHELCGGDIGAIERMIELGHKALALEAATEVPGVVKGMKEILLRLGDDPDAAFAQSAWRHLALHYRTLHPAAAGSGLVKAFPDWHPRSEAFALWSAGEAGPMPLCSIQRTRPAHSNMPKHGNLWIACFLKTCGVRLAKASSILTASRGRAGWAMQ